MSDAFKSLRKKVTTLCQVSQDIEAPRAAPDVVPDLPPDFPMGLWRHLGRENLMGILVPEEYNGLGLGLDALACATEQLVICGASMGFALSFLMHHLVCYHFILTHGTKALWDRFLPTMAQGKITAAVAVSEPKIGAHPKHLKTRAIKEKGAFIIDGKKSFVTNAPLADLFIVVAVTGVRSMRNQFSALVVPRTTAGLFIGSPMDLGILHPCPHATLTLAQCRIEADLVTGSPDLAYETMVIPFRHLEQLLVPVIISGAMGNLTRNLAGRLQNTKIADLRTRADCLSHMVYATVKGHMNHPGDALTSAAPREFARAAEAFWQDARQLMAETDLPPSRAQNEFDHDLRTLLGLFPR